MLIRAFPALETIILGEMSEVAASQMCRNLREFCPRLREIRNLGVHQTYSLHSYP